MAVDKSFIVRKIQNKEEMIVAFCAYTGMPFVICDPESFNDQVWIFDTEEQLQAFGKPYTEKKIALRGMKFKQEHFLQFFSSLYTMGINELVFVEETGNTIIALEDLVRQPDYSQMKPEQRPVLNPQLQLTGMYFMQEASRPIPNEQKENLKDLEEELAANMVKSRYLIAIELNDGPETIEEKLKNKAYRLPILKNKQEEVLQPIFTDPIEFQKFAKGRKNLRAIAVPFSDLSRLIVKDAKGFMLNPFGYHIMMPKELLEGLKKRFPQMNA